MAFHGDLTVAGGKAHTSFLRDSHYVLEGKRLFIAIKESISSNGIVMYLRKGCPLLDRYNAIIFREVEAGLVNKWWEDQDFDDEEDKDGDGDEDHYDSRRNLRVLSLSHLQGAFCLWVVGLAMALVAYITEIVWLECAYVFYYTSGPPSCCRILAYTLEIVVKADKTVW